MPRTTALNDAPDVNGVHTVEGDQDGRIYLVSERTHKGNGVVKIRSNAANHRSTTTISLDAELDETYYRGCPRMKRHIHTSLPMADLAQHTITISISSGVLYTPWVLHTCNDAALVQHAQPDAQRPQDLKRQVLPATRDARPMLRVRNPQPVRRLLHHIADPRRLRRLRLLPSASSGRTKPPRQHIREYRNPCPQAKAKIDGEHSPTGTGTGPSSIPSPAHLLSIPP